MYARTPSGLGFARCRTARTQLMSYLNASWTVKLGAAYLITLVARRRISGGGFIILHKQRIIDLEVKSRLASMYTTAQTLA